MMRRHFLFLAILAGLGLALGFLLSPNSAETRDRAESDQWRPPVAPVDYSNSVDRFRSDLLRSGLFPVEPDADISAETANPVESEQGPDFPTILSVARIDGEYAAQVRLQDRSITSVRAGDVLPGDWVVNDVTFDQVVALRDGELVTFDISPG